MDLAPTTSPAISVQNPYPLGVHKTVQSLGYSKSLSEAAEQLSDCNHQQSFNMSARRVSADPDMLAWVQEMMVEDVCREDKNGTKEVSSDETASVNLINTKPNDNLRDICCWKGRHAHDGVSHEQVAERYWDMLYGRRNLQCDTKVYRYTACIHACCMKKHGSCSTSFPLSMSDARLKPFPALKLFNSDSQNMRRRIIQKHRAKKKVRRLAKNMTNE